MEGSYQFIHVEAYAREGSSQTKTIVKKNGDKVATTECVVKPINAISFD